MTDLTVSILLVVIILMAFMATQMRDTRLLDDLAAAQVALDDARAELAEARLEGDRQALALGQLRRTIAEGDSLRARLEAQAESLRGELTSARAAGDQLGVQLSEARRENSRVRTALAEAQSSLALTSAELSASAQRAQALALEGVALRESAQRLDAERARLGSEIATLREDLAQREARAAADAEALRTQITNLSDRLRTSEARAEAERARLEVVRGELAAAGAALMARAEAADALARELAAARAQLAAARTDIERRDAQILQLDATLRDAQSAQADALARLGERAEQLEQKIATEALRRERAEGHAETLTGIVGALRKSLGAAQARAAQVKPLEEALAGAQSELGEAAAELTRSEAARKSLAAEYLSEKTARGAEASAFGAQIGRLELALAGAARELQVARDQAAALSRRAEELGQALAGEQRSAAALRGAAAALNRQLAAALSIDTPDPALILEKVSRLQRVPVAGPGGAERVRRDLAGARLEVEMLTQQNATLKKTIQTLLANNAKITERLGNR